MAAITARYPQVRNRNNFLIFFCLFSLANFFAVSPRLSAGVPAKAEVLAKYEQAIARAEEYNVYEQDTFKIIPKIRIAGKLILRNDFASADRLLNKILSDLDLLKTQKPAPVQRALRLEWLEIYRDLIQKYAVLALLAYFFIRWVYFKRMILADRLTLMGKVYLSFLVIFCAIFLSAFDLSHYGESAWAFFDIQIVFLVIGGLLGGVWAGFFSGLVIGVFRALVSPVPIYFVMAVMIGILSGILSWRIKTYRATGRISFISGTLMGIVHGLVIYLPMAHLLPPVLIISSIGFVALLEGVGVFIFFSVISGILREESRHRTEQELLKTQLLFLQAQMSPHFLYNALNTISAICVRENASQAHHLVLRLAEFLRRTLRRFDDQVTLREEMTYIDSYLEIEKARFHERLNVEKQLDLREELWEVKIPLLILQPLIENAIKHGISKKEEGGRLQIHMAEDAGNLKIEIVDDGVGASQTRLDDILAGRIATSEEVGIGVQNINQRLRRFYGEKYGLKLESLPGKGTKAVVIIPLKGSCNI